MPSRLQSPLAWPYWNKGRKSLDERRRGLFSKEKKNGNRGRLTILEAQERLLEQFRLYTSHGQNWRVPEDTIFITTDRVIRNRSDRKPSRQFGAPDDPGVAVYFELDGHGICLGCDTYDRVADNIAAIAAHIDADRTQDRHGVTSVEERYAGMQALPAVGETSGRKWYEYFGLDMWEATEAELKAAYHEKAKVYHPDVKGTGNEAEWTITTRLYAQGQAALRGRQKQLT